jgi:hypothetical protein
MSSPLENRPMLSVQIPTIHWRADLAALRASDIRSQVYSTTNMKQLEKIPIGVLANFAELCRALPEIRVAVLALQSFYSLPDRTGEDDPRLPFREEEVMSEFISWFTLKSTVGPSNFSGYLTYGMSIAEALIIGRFSSASSGDAIKYLKSQSGAEISIEFN